MRPASCLDCRWCKQKCQPQDRDQHEAACLDEKRRRHIEVCTAGSNAIKSALFRQLEQARKRFYSERGIEHA